MTNKLLIIGFVWPEPKSSAAGSRMMQLIEAFKHFEYTITFASACVKTDNAVDLKSIGVCTQTIRLNHPDFDAFISELKPDVVLFDRFMTEEQYGWRVAQHCPNALRILDTEDLHFLRKARQQAFKEGKPFDDSYLYNDYTKREIASIYRCDISLIISEFEHALLTDTFHIPSNLLLYLPFMLYEIPKETIETFPKFSQRQHFITIGNFLHEPNYDAVRYLKDNIWKLIKQQLPEAELHIYGAYESQKVTQLHDAKTGFLIKGFAEDVNNVMQNSRVCLASLRFGAGLKGKLIDAMQNGTPCVMTPIAAEGLFGNFSPNGFITDDVQEFANKAVQLYNNENEWREFQSNGFEVINHRFPKQEFQEKFLSKIEQSIQQLSANRQNNFVGQMLMHHTMQSTKYLSKWIELKAQNNQKD